MSIIVYKGKLTFVIIYKRVIIVAVTFIILTYIYLYLTLIMWWSSNFECLLLTSDFSQVTTQEKLCKIAIAQGELVGKQIILPSKKTYYSYQGIPYAKPPVGKLRFKVGWRVSKMLF